MVSPDTLLSDLHKIIQTTMGWENMHLHQFMKDTTFYTMKTADGFDDDPYDVDSSKIKISGLLKKAKDKMVYTYDFGDSWQHDIILEKIDPEGDNKNTPLCLTGKNNCPPEDCGGVWGYANMLAVANNPGHEEYEMVSGWFGEGFDPEYFDKEEINKRLKTKDFGCFPFF